MAINFSEFKDLPPERRLRELQKLIDSLKKEIEERQDEIKQAEQLLALADEEARLLEQVEIPQAKSPTVKTKEIEERVEVKEEKEEKKRITREEQLELEKLLATAPRRSDELFHQVAHRRVDELYSELRRIYDRQKETGVETEKEREMIYAIRKGFEIKREEGYTPSTKKNKNLMTAAEQMAESMYQTAAGTYKTNPT